MIKYDDGKKTPGNVWPNIDHVEDVEPVMAELIKSYIEDEGWLSGQPVLILGSKSSGKTATGLFLIRQIFQVQEVLWAYWKESHFYLDTKLTWHNQKLMEEYSSEVTLWDECAGFNSKYDDLRQVSVLFLDNVGLEDSDWNHKTLEAFLQDRSDLRQTTIIGSTTELWRSIPGRVRQPFEEGLVLRCERR